MTVEILKRDPVQRHSNKVRVIETWNRDPRTTSGGERRCSCESAEVPLRRECRRLFSVNGIPFDSFKFWECVRSVFSNVDPQPTAVVRSHGDHFAEVVRISLVGAWKSVVKLQTLLPIEKS